MLTNCKIFLTAPPLTASTTSANETACTWQPHLRPGCYLHAVSSLYVIVVHGPLTPWLRMVTIQVCTQTRAGHPGYRHLKSIPHSLKPIVMTHCIWWTIVMTNLDSHMSELCCLLSLHVLDYALLHDVRIATCRGSIKNKAIFFFSWPPSFSILSHCLQFQKTQKQEKSRITT